MSAVATTQPPFIFDRDYKNPAQVAYLYDEFVAVFEQVKKSGSDFAYNDSFKGRLTALAGTDSKNEDTAIFLLQGLRRTVEQSERIEADRAAGLRRCTLTNRETRKFPQVVVHTGDCRRIDWTDARVVAGEAGELRCILAKGKRSLGYRLREADVVLVGGAES